MAYCMLLALCAEAWVSSSKVDKLIELLNAVRARNGGTAPPTGPGGPK